jgi:hypothetical protein
MSKFIMWGVALALLVAATMVAFRLTHRPASAAPAQPLDPAILETHQRQLRDDLWLP